MGAELESDAGEAVGTVVGSDEGVAVGATIAVGEQEIDSCGYFL